MKNRKRLLIGLGILAFMAIMVLNVQLVQNPVGGEGMELSLVELSASAAGEGSEGGGGNGSSILFWLANWWANLLQFFFGGGIN